MPPAETNGHHVLSNGHRPPIASREEAAAEAYVLVKERGYSIRAARDELCARGWDCSKTTVHDMVKEARKAEPFLDLLDREEARRDQAERLHGYYRIMMEELRGGRVTGREFVKDMEWLENRWAKLAGLDAPRQHHVQVDDQRDQQATPNMELFQEMRRAVNAHEAQTRELEEQDGLDS